MLDGNAVLFVLLQFGSRFANSFLTTAARYELLEAGGVATFASAQVATSVARMLVSQVSGVLTDNLQLKAMYVLSEGCNFVVAVIMLVLGHGHTKILFSANLALGLIFAFSQPLTKSMPPAVAKREDLAIVNGWDLTCDKVGRYLAPLAYAIVSSQYHFRSAALFSSVVYAVLTLLRTRIRVAEESRQRPRPGATGTGIASGFLGLCRQVVEGVVSLRRDRILALLILNTVVTNIFVYPLNSVHFPVLFREVAAKQESAGSTQSTADQLLTAVTNLLGIHKKHAWMNYVGLVSLGGVVGPFASNLLVYLVETYANYVKECDTWVGLQVGILGQVASCAILAIVVAAHNLLGPGMLVLALVFAWVLTIAMNNVVTTYFNSCSQERLQPGERGRFIANIMTIFTLGNSLGTMLFGWVLSDAEGSVSGSIQILCVGMCTKLVLLMLLYGRRVELQSKGEKAS